MSVPITPEQPGLPLRELGMRRTALSWPMATAAAMAAVLLLLCGYVASLDGAPSVIALVAAFGLFGVVLAKRVGIAVGVLVLAAQDGLPFVDTGTHFVNGLAVTNYLVISLITILAVRAASSSLRPARGASALAMAGAGLAVWWVVTVARSGGEPVGTAASFGRNFLIFALLVALFPLGLRKRRDQIHALGTVCLGALLYTFGQIILTVTGARLSWLIHPVAIRAESGLPRVYADMSDAAVLLFCLAVGAALLGRKRRLRQFAALVGLVSGAAVVLEQTRAIYLSLPVALLCSLFAWQVLVPAARARISRRALGAVIGTAVLIGVLASVAPSIVATYGGQPISRLNTVFTELNGHSGSLGYRFTVAHQLISLLHGSVANWITGLGFLDPQYHYFPSLPLGSIRNQDLGLVDGIMLIGLAGVGLVYFVVLWPLWRTASTARAWVARLPDHGWLVFGLTTWLLQVVLASYTLGTLWQQPGQVLVSMVVAVLLLSLASVTERRAVQTTPDLPV